MRRLSIIAASCIFIECALAESRARALELEQNTIADMEGDRASAGTLDLRLEAYVNGKSTGLLVSARKSPDGAFAVERGDLEEIGVKPPGAGGRKDMVVLNGSGLAYRYDEPKQQLYFDLSDDQRIPKIYDSRGERPAVPSATSSWGGLVNYVMFASSSTAITHWRPAITAASLSTDIRIFSPYGVVTQTGIIGNTNNFNLYRANSTIGLRLETAYVYADPDTQTMYRAGDTISGALDWTRPMRLGGIQIQRNFAMRPDIVTAALPSVSGSAAVPSSVDVLVNGAPIFTQQVSEGPFRIANLPVSSANGNAEVVIRDASGRETRTDLSLFTNERLIAPGLFDYTFEAGFARKFYAYRSNDYDNRPVVSSSARYGVTDQLTVLGHAEVGSGLYNGSIGAATQFGRFGSLTAAVSGSRYLSAFGGQGYASYNVMTPLGVSFSASTQQTFGAYDDLASATAARWAADSRSFYLYTPQTNQQLAANLVFVHPPRMINRISIGAKLPVIGGNASFTFAQITPDNRDRIWAWQSNRLMASQTLTASYSRQLPYEGSLFVTVFGNISGIENKGVFAGVSFPIGGNVQVGGGAQTVFDPTTGKGRIGFNAQASKNMEASIGSYGWSLNRTQGPTSMTNGAVSYRTPVGTARINGLQQANFVSGAAQFEGAIALADMNVAIGPKVEDSFAIVNAGAPGVTVTHDNSRVGETNVLGTLLIPTLRSYQRNKVDIDLMTLPVDVVSVKTQEVVAPRYRSGVAIDFGAKANAKPIVLVLTDKAGKPIEVGSRGKLVDSDSAFVVGYDGRAFVTDLAASNSIIIDLGTRDCRGSFEAPQTAGPNREIRVTCE